MKVTDASSIGDLDLSRQAELGRAQRPEQSDTGDRVTTEQSAQVATAVAEAARQRGPAARAETLQAIETAVRQGTYTQNPARIAERILEQAELAARLQALLKR